MAKHKNKPQPDKSAHVIRAALGIDTWGDDFYRIKGRIGTIMIQLEEQAERIEKLEKAEADRHVSASLGSRYPGGS